MRLRAAAFILVIPFLVAPPSIGGPIPAPKGPPGKAPAHPVVFETSFPLDELRVTGWTEAQRREVAGIVRRIGSDDRIRLVVHVQTDSIGSREENARWGKAVGEAVAARLVASGVPADRVAVSPSVEVGPPGNGAPWIDFARFQRVVIRGVREGVAAAARPRSPRRGM